MDKNEVRQLIMNRRHELSDEDPKFYMLQYIQKLS